MTDSVLFERRDAVGIITLNRPETGNAIDPDTARALIRCIDRALGDPPVRAVLIRATGRQFCVGGNIRFFADAGAQLAPALDALLPPLHAALNRLATSDLPVVSAVNGAVGGGGIGLALCADIVLAGESMKLRGGYSAIGLTPDAGTSWFLARRIGAMRTKQVLFTNEPVSVRRCFEWGLVGEVVPDDELAARALALAGALSRSATRVLGRIKQLVDGALDRTLEAQLQLEHRYMAESASDTEAAEGIAAFLAKRDSQFG